MKVIDDIEKSDLRATNNERKNFKSKWDYVKSFSRWHFDKWRKEEDPFNVFMRIEGDWGKILDDLDFEISVGLDNYVYKGEEGDGLIERDYRDWGYLEQMRQYQRTYNIPEKLKLIAAELHLDHPDIRIHKQIPGMVAPIHADAYCSHPAIHEDPTLNVADMRRFLIQLTDWDWGHHWHFGNNPWVQWKAGDVVYFESRDVIHSTANSGKCPRFTMVVTGWMTDKTRELINGEKKIVKI